MRSPRDPIYQCVFSGERSCDMLTDDDGRLTKDERPTRPGCGVTVALDAEL